MDGNAFYDAKGLRLTSLLRLTLAISGLLLMESIHRLPGQFEVTTVFMLFCYVIYSALICGFVFHNGQLRHSRWWHWLDVAWWLAVIASAGSISNVFYLFFIYPIIISTFRSGANEGITVSVVSVVSWLLVAMLELGADARPEQWRAVLLRAATLLVLGYVIALWAGFEALQQKRLALFGELNRLPNPRFGTERLIAAALERLCDFYQADNCIVVMDDEGKPIVHMARKTMSESMPAKSSPGMLLALPEQSAVAYNAPTLWTRLFGSHLHIEGAASREQKALIRSCAHVLAHEFGGACWVSVPLQLQDEVLGRLYLVARRGHFGDFDICMLRQAMSKFLPLVETVKLLDGLASKAAEQERRKISLDFHDSAIQPYLGLKLGLESLRRKLDGSNPLAADLDDLYRMTVDSIAELRGYVGVLNTQPQERRLSLMDGLQRQVDKFRDLYNLEIQVNAPTDMTLNDRLTVELLQMIGESLSNIGRHTSSQQVTINLASGEDRLTTQIINHAKDGTAEWKSFTPASLTNRAQYLGGSVDVGQHPDGGTAVKVTIPL